MFSYVDLVRVEIAMEAETHFNITIPEAEMDRWRTLGDVARSVVSRSEVPATEPFVFEWVRKLIVEGYGDTEAEKLTADSDAFGDYDRATTWFSSRPYPTRLGDRWFANNPALARERAVPYYCAYNSPTELTALPPALRTQEVVQLARQMSASQDFSSLPSLADALEKAGCNARNSLHGVMLYHCRDSNATHIHGCWVIDLVLERGRYGTEQVG